MRSDDRASPEAANAAQEKALKEWAAENGKLIPESRFNAAWEKGGRRGESEHQVYFDQSTQRWWKRNLLNFHSGSILAYLERVAAIRYFFPDTDTRFEGFTEVDGHLYPVVSQKHMAGIEPTEAQIASHLKRLGFKEVYATGKGTEKARQLATAAGLKPAPAKPVVGNNSIQPLKPRFAPDCTIATNAEQPELSQKDFGCAPSKPPLRVGQPMAWGLYPIPGRDKESTCVFAKNLLRPASDRSETFVAWTDRIEFLPTTGCKSLTWVAR